MMLRLNFGGVYPEQGRRAQCKPLSTDHSGANPPAGRAGK